MKILLGSVVLLVVLSSVMDLAYSQSDAVPEWIKDVAGFWAEGKITDQEFIGALEFLIESGIIRVDDPRTIHLENELAEHKSMIELLKAGNVAQDEKIDDVGDFYVTYEPNPNSKYMGSSVASVWLQDTGLLEYEAEYLNDAFRLPHDIEIIARECGEINAFYYPGTKHIEICYEFVDDLFDKWYQFNHPDDHDDYAATSYAKNILTHTVHHEVAHALIDVYDLPITGLEENVADQFATLVISSTFDPETGDDAIGKQMLYDVGLNYKYAAEYNDMHQQDAPYWDTHGLDWQRYYNILCYTYGADPEYSQYLVDLGVLPENRAGYCEDEYAKIEQSWDHLLTKYAN